MIFIEAVALVIGFGLMVLASKWAVEAATALAAGSGVSPFVIGLTLLAIGTDLPEFANSITSSVTGHGDVNVGDSVGSAATQMTLVLGLLPLLAGMIKVPKDGIRLTGFLTVAGLVLLAVLMTDGHIGRTDAALLLVVWALGSVLVYRRSRHHHQLALPLAKPARRGPLVITLLLAFILLAVSATVALWGVLGISESLGTPEFLVGFFIAAVGTSLPELVFDLTALRRGQVAMALGDVMGSSFVDVTASVAIGPLIAPIDVTRDLVLRGALAAAVAIAIVTVIMSRITDHDWRSGTILLGVYGAFFLVLL